MADDSVKGNSGLPIRHSEVGQEDSGSAVGLSDWTVPELIEDLWELRLPSLIQKMSDIVEALSSDDSADEHARMQAHKLRGNLGTFGFKQGSAVAGRAEDLLKDPNADPSLRRRTALECRAVLAELERRLVSGTANDTGGP